MLFRLLFCCFVLLLPSVALAADNATLITPCASSCVTMRSKDIGAGVQSMIQILGDTSGNAIYGTAGTANANVISVQGIASGTNLPVSQATAGNLNATVVGTGTFATQSAVTAASGSYSSGAFSSGAFASGSIASGAITSGAVASGAYASGSIADGAMVTLGTKADAATCATTNSAIACLRQIDTDVQAGVGATGSAVPAASIYPGLNVGGTLRGATGVNPSGSVYAQQHDVTSVNGVTVLTGSGATGTGAQRVTVSTDQATNAGAALVKGGVGVVNGGSTYQHIAASQTATVLQTSTGAAGDYLSHCVIYPSTTAAGSVTVFDNANAAATNVIEFTTGTLSNLAPISVPVGAVSTAGAWKVTTGANETVVCFGKFS